MQREDILVRQGQCDGQDSQLKTSTVMGAGLSNPIIMLVSLILNKVKVK